MITNLCSFYMVVINGKFNEDLAGKTLDFGDYFEDYKQGTGFFYFNDESNKTIKRFYSQLQTSLCL